MTDDRRQAAYTTMDDLILERPVVVPLGVVEMPTTMGMTVFDDSQFFAATLHVADGREPRIVLMTAGYGPDGPSGFMAQFDADGARSLAAGLCQLAEKLGAVSQ